MRAKTLLVSAGAIFFLFMVGLAMSTGEAHASRSYLNDFTTAYPTSATSNASCAVCHLTSTGSPSSPRNVYGAAWAAANYDFAVVGAQNSDGVGGTNAQEITAGTQPGWCVQTTTGCLQTTGTPPAVSLDDVAPPSTNRPPVLAAIGAKSVNENQLLTFTATATDLDGNALTFSGGNLPSGATLNATTGAFSWTPTFAQAGNYNVTITVTDNGSPAASDFEVVTITVGNVNRPPTLDPIGNKSVNENQLLTFTATATDLDGNALTFSGGNLPSGATLTPAGAFSWTPTAGQTGPFSVTVTVTDNGSPAQTDSETFTITVANVTPVNQPPVLNPIGAKTVNEGQTLAFTATATDPDGGPLTFSGGTVPSGPALTPAGAFSWTPDFTQAGTYNVTITVTDNGGLTDSETFTITVGNVNRPPVLSPSPIGNRTVTIGQTLTIATTASDPDGGALSFTSANLPSGATLTPATPAGTGAATFSWTPTTGQAGTYQNVTITVSDGALTDAEVFTITVQASSPTPVCTMTVSPTALAFGSVNVGSSKTMTTTIGNSGTANCTVSSRTVSGAGFALGSGAPSVPITIAPGANVSVPVNFTPTVAGAASGSLTIGSTVVSLSATGVTVTPLPTGGSVDLNIVRFRATEEVELGEGKTVRFQLVVKDVSKVTGSAPATLVGMQKGVEVYRQALNVSVPAGKVATLSFPPYTPTAAGKIKWTVTIQDQGPARNTATATTEVEGEDREEREDGDRKRS